MTKELRKEIMKRSKLLNIYHRDKSAASKEAYNRQRNICTSLCRKNKREYYSRLNPSSVTCNKIFWKAIKPLFSEKMFNGESITLVDIGSIIDNNTDVADTFSEFFSNAVKNLCIENIDTFSNVDNINNIYDPILKVIKRFENHPSILKIHEFVKNEELFDFSHISPEIVSKEIDAFNVTSACPKDSIPPNIIKCNADIFSSKLSHDFNLAIDNGIFPSNLKQADITPAYKKGDKTDKTTYRPVSILPAVSKIMERIIFQQIESFSCKILSKHQCGFRKQFNSQHCLILMLEKWKRAMDNREISGALLTDLSKALDCLDHDLLLAKLNAYGFGYKSLEFMISYLVNRYQRVKVNSSYSSWTEIISGVPQGSIVGPILFNIYLSDLFLFLENSNIANYADDNTPYTSGKEVNDVICNIGGRFQDVNSMGH